MTFLRSNPNAKWIIIGMVLLCVILAGTITVWIFIANDFKVTDINLFPVQVTVIAKDTTPYIDENKSYSAHYYNGYIPQSLMIFETYHGYKKKLFYIDNINPCQAKTALVYFHERYGLNSVTQDYSMYSVNASMDVITFCEWWLGGYGRDKCDPPTKMTVAEIEIPYVEPTPIPTLNTREYYEQTIIVPTPSPTLDPNVFHRIYS